MKFLSKIRYFPDRPTRFSGPYVTRTKQLFCHGLTRWTRVSLITGKTQRPPIWAPCRDKNGTGSGSRYIDHSSPNGLKLCSLSPGVKEVPLTCILRCLRHTYALCSSSSAVISAELICLSIYALRTDMLYFSSGPGVDECIFEVQSTVLGSGMIPCSFRIACDIL